MEEKEIKKVLKSGKGMLITTIVFLVVTLGLIGAGLYSRFSVKMNVEELGTLIDNNQDKEGKYAKIKIAYLPYVFAEEDTDRYYYFAFDAEKFMYIIRMTDETYEHLKEMSNNGENEIDYEFEGYTFNITSNLKKLIVEEGNKAFDEKVLTSSNVSSYVGNVYIDEKDVPTDDPSNTFYGIAVVAGMFLVIFGIAWIAQIVREKKIFGNKELMEELENELSRLNDNPYGKMKLYLTNKYIITKTGGLLPIEYKNVIWVYSQIRYVNGVAQGKTLILCTKDKKKHSVASTGANDASIDEIMVEIKDRNENVRIGFTKENREYYRNYQKEVM